MSEHAEDRASDDATRTDVLLITSRRLSDDDHGAGVRTARIADVLTARYRVVVVQPAPADRAPLPGIRPAGGHDVIEFPLGPLSLRHATSRGSTEGRSMWAGVDAATLARIEQVRPRVVFWADAILASAGIGAVAADAPQVVEFANVESRRYLAMARDGSVKRRLFAVWEAAKAVAWQRAVVRGSDAVVTLAESDARVLRPRGPRIVVRNGIAAPAVAPGPSAGSTVLAVGSWWYGPNRHGMRRFLRDDWPRVRAALPAARLLIVGAGGDDLADRLPDGVEVQGFVDDLEPLYAASALVLAPARSGGGSQLKLVGALARGRVVVGPRFLRRERTSGMPAAALQASADMAGTILELLGAPERRLAIERDIRAWCESSGWAATAVPLTARLDGLLARAADQAGTPRS